MFERQEESENMTVGRDDSQYEHLAQRAAVLLANSLKAMIDGSIRKVAEQKVIDVAPFRGQLSQISDKQQTILDQIPAKLTQLETRLAKVQTSQQQVVYSLERIEKQLEQLSAESKLLANVSQENCLLGKEHYQDHIVQPMVRSLFGLFDLVEEARGKTAECSGNGEIQSIIKAVSIQLRQFLSTYKIEPIQHKPGAKFNPSEMRPVKKVYTHNRRLDGRVEKSLQAGFRCGEDKLLRSESMSLYKYRGPRVEKPREKGVDHESRN